jgi:hypothetical protein
MSGFDEAFTEVQRGHEVLINGLYNTEPDWRRIKNTGVEALRVDDASFEIARVELASDITSNLLAPIGAEAGTVREMQLHFLAARTFAMLETDTTAPKTPLERAVALIALYADAVARGHGQEKTSALSLADGVGDPERLGRSRTRQANRLGQIAAAGLQSSGDKIAAKVRLMEHSHAFLENYS